jgi:hypothetical protein
MPSDRGTRAARSGVADAGRLDADLRSALLTGAVGWRDRNSSYTPAEWMVLAVLVASVVAVVSILFTSAGLPATGVALTGGTRWLAALVGALTLVAGVGPTLAWPFGWRPARTGLLQRFAWLRVAGAAVLVGCWTALLGPLVASVTAWPLGAVVGCECALTGWALGVEPSGPAWWLRFQRSSVHLGVLLLCAVAVLVAPDLGWSVVGVLFTVQVIALAAALVCHGLGALGRRFGEHDRLVERAVVAGAHERLAYWLHNSVTTPLRHLRLRALAPDVPALEVAAALEAVELELRRRQLEEEMATGEVDVAAILQLQVRRAEDRGVRVVDVPRFDETGPHVDGEVGRRVQRVLDVLVPNAIAAGARTLAFGIAPAPDGLVVEVTDDAGGFDLADVPAGRALHGLQRDLGPGCLRVVPTDGGSRVSVTVAAAAGPRRAVPSR